MKIKNLMLVAGLSLSIILFGCSSSGEAKKEDTSAEATAEAKEDTENSTEEAVESTPEYPVI